MVSQNSSRTEIVSDSTAFGLRGLAEAGNAHPASRHLVAFALGTTSGGFVGRFIRAFVDPHSLAHVFVRGFVIVMRGVMRIFFAVTMVRGDMVHSIAVLIMLVRDGVRWTMLFDVIFNWSFCWSGVRT